MRNILLLSIGIILMSCNASKITRYEQYKTMYAERPLSILVMPPINRTTEVEAKEYFYSSLTVPITLKGYYVMPPMLTMEILKEEGAYDAELFVNNSMKQVGDLFGVDAVLFTTIHEWAKTTALSRIKVVVEYTLKSSKTDEILFNRKGEIIYSPNASGGNVFVNLAVNMLTTALTKEIEIGRKCNVYTLSDMPAGYYDTQHEKDGEVKAGKTEFSVKLQ